MSAPAFWGLDPALKYRWVPRCARMELEPAGVDEGGEYVPAKLGGPVKGAPVILLSPLPDRLSMRVTAARQRYYSILARMHARKGDGAPAADLMDEALDKLDAIYSEDLQLDVLSACVAGWENVKRPDGTDIAFAGKWEADGMVLPGSIKAELFNEIVKESAFTQAQLEAFTSPQESQQS